MNNNKSKIRCKRGFTLIEQVIAVVKQSCHPEFISGSTPLVAIQNKEEMLKQVQHDMRSEEMLKPFNQTPYYNLTGLGPKVMASVQHDNRRRGFTLIELLVVVLIIGILAAVAVPQYKKAHERSLLSKMLVSAKQLHEAQREYLLANGYSAYKMEELSVDFSGPVLNSYTNSSLCGTGTKLGGHALGGGIIDLGEYEIGIATTNSYKRSSNTVSLACLKDACKCVGFVDDRYGLWGEGGTSNLYGSPVCWQGIGVPGYGSIWGNEDWCSQTFHVKGSLNHNGSGLSYYLVGI